MREWDGDYAVYNPLSGDTHLLDIVAGEVLKLIRGTGTGTNEICLHIAGFLDVANDERLAASIETILARLDELGLIEAAGEC